MNSSRVNRKNSSFRGRDPPGTIPRSCRAPGRQDGQRWEIFGLKGSRRRARSRLVTKRQRLAGMPETLAQLADGETVSAGRQMSAVTSRRQGDRQRHITNYPILARPPPPSLVSKMCLALSRRRDLLLDDRAARNHAVNRSVSVEADCLSMESNGQPLPRSDVRSTARQLGARRRAALGAHTGMGIFFGPRTNLGSNVGIVWPRYG